jgi:adenine-specific DNA-methyltransferase
MIYIDPPYNTGKDYVYTTISSGCRDYDEATEYKDEAGNIQFKRTTRAMALSSDWLSMMYHG